MKSEKNFFTERDLVEQKPVTHPREQNRFRCDGIFILTAIIPRRNGVDMTTSAEVHHTAIHRTDMYGVADRQD